VVRALPDMMLLANWKAVVDPVLSTGTIVVLSAELAEAAEAGVEMEPNVESVDAGTGC
jgi:hypothetical protein